MNRIDPRPDGFSDFFKVATGGFAPYDWQQLVALDGLPEVLSVPVGVVADLPGAWRLDENSDTGAVPQGEPRNAGPFAIPNFHWLVRMFDWRGSDPVQATNICTPSAYVSPELPTTGATHP